MIYVYIDGFFCSKRCLYAKLFTIIQCGTEGAFDIIGLDTKHLIRSYDVVSPRSMCQYTP